MLHVCLCLLLSAIPVCDVHINAYVTKRCTLSWSRCGVLHMVCVFHPLLPPYPPGAIHVGPQCVVGLCGDIYILCQLQEVSLGVTSSCSTAVQTSNFCFIFPLFSIIVMSAYGTTHCVQYCKHIVYHIIPYACNL